VRLRPVYEGGLVRFQAGPAGRLILVVTNLDTASFTESWLTASEAAQSR
jgi:hypothetical protein